MDTADRRILGATDFLEQVAGKPLTAKILQALGHLPGGEVPIYALCLSDEKLSYTLFNHLAVPAQWDHSVQRELQCDVFETVFLVEGREKYDEIKIGQTAQFSIDWRGEALKFGPVEAVELCVEDRLETFQINSAIIHYQRHAGRFFEFLIEAQLIATAKEWQLLSIPNFPNFLSLSENLS